MGDAPRAAILNDRAILAMWGPDRVKFLQGLVTNDVRRLAPQGPIYAGILSGHGKLVTDVFLIEDGERILIDVAASHVEELLRRLARFRLGAQVEFGPAEPVLAVAVLWGSDAQGLAAGAVRHAFADPRLRELGVRLVYPQGAPIDQELEGLGVLLADARDYAARRLSLGVAETAELGQEAFYPLEANFEGLNGIDFKKGCYVGQELTARMHLKSGLRQRLLPVTGREALPQPGSSVTSADRAPLGTLVLSSGARGLAMIRLDRLAAAREDDLLAGLIPISVRWPSWLAR